MNKQTNSQLGGRSGFYITGRGDSSSEKPTAEGCRNSPANCSDSAYVGLLLMADCMIDFSARSG